MKAYEVHWIRMSSYEFSVYQYSQYSYEFMYMCAYEFLWYLINHMFSIILEIIIIVLHSGEFLLMRSSVHEFLCFLLILGVSLFLLCLWNPFAFMWTPMMPINIYIHNIDSVLSIPTHSYEFLSMPITS